MANTTTITLTDHQRSELVAFHRGFGRWDAEDANSPALLESIVEDLQMFAEGCDTEWITPEHIAAFIRSGGPDLPGANL